MCYTLTVEYVARIPKLSTAYRDDVDQFANAHDLKELQSAAVETKALAAEIDVLIKEMLGRIKSK